uniref:Uncharacterized protein n=1 Tax=Spumella elongata TaxID=89044 RepID=A0A7S3MB03_9STRA
MSVPGLFTSTRSYSKANKYDHMDLEVQAILKGVIQSMDPILRPIIENEVNDPSVLPFIECPNFDTLMSLYKDAVLTGNEEAEMKFTQAWEEFRTVHTKVHTYLSNERNSAEHVLFRAGADCVRAWGSESMTIPVLVKLLEILHHGYGKRDEDIQKTLAKFHNLLKDLPSRGTVETGLKFEDYFNSACTYFADGTTGDEKKALILPIFSSNHATYGVIQPSYAIPSHYRITICNGGSEGEYFSNLELTEGKEAHEINMKGSCVILANLDNTRRFVHLVGRYWEDMSIFDKLHTFIAKACAERSGAFIVLDEKEMNEGECGEFPGQQVALLKQFQGNCAVNNLINALVMCHIGVGGINKYKPGDFHWPELPQAFYYVLSILSTELIRRESDLRAYLTVDDYDRILLSSIKFFFRNEYYQRYCPCN